MRIEIDTIIIINMKSNRVKRGALSGSLVPNNSWLRVLDTSIEASMLE